MRLFAPDDLSLGEPAFAPLADAAARDEILALLRGHWAALGNPDQAVSIAVGGGALRRNLLVVIGGERYVLKGVTSTAAAERLAEELELERHLRAHGVPVAASVPAADGAGVVAREQGAWVLHRFVAGKHFTGIGRELDSAGETFARLTRACAPLPAASAVPLGDVGVRLHESFDVPRLGDRLAPHREVLSEAAAAAERLPATELVSAVVHLDFHPANLLLDGERVTCVLDLEDVVPYPVLPAMSFAAYKLIRQVLVDDAVRAAERAEPTLVVRWLDCWQQLPAPRRTPGELRVGAEYRVLALIDLILDQYLRLGEDRLFPELAKQLRALYEIPEIFGPRSWRTA